jgi:hypothetical protein
MTATWLELQAEMEQIESEEERVWEHQHAVLLQKQIDGQTEALQRLNTTLERLQPHWQAFLKLMRQQAFRMEAPHIDVKSVNEMNMVLERCLKQLTALGKSVHDKSDVVAEIVETVQKVQALMKQQHDVLTDCESMAGEVEQANVENAFTALLQRHLHVQ